MDTIRKTIIDVLLEKNRLTVSEAAGFDKFANNEEVEKKLRDNKMVSSEDIAKAYAVIYDLPFIRLENYDISREALEFIPKDLVEKYKIISFEKVGDKKIKVALGDPAKLKLNPPAIINELKEKRGLTVDLYITTPEDIGKVVSKFTTIPVAQVKDFDQPISYPQTAHLKTIDLKSMKIPLDVISKFPIEISQKYQMVVFANPDMNTIRVAVSDPSNPKVKEILDFVRDRNQIKIEEFVASPAEIGEAIKLYYQKPKDENVVVEQEIPVSLPDLPVELEKKPEPEKPEPVKSEEEVKKEPEDDEKEEPVFGHFFDHPKPDKDEEKYGHHIDVEKVGEKIVQRDISGIDTTSPISKMQDTISHVVEPKLPDALKSEESQKIIDDATKSLQASSDTEDQTDSTASKVSKERRKFVRRPIPYDQQNQEQKPIEEDETASSAVIAPENDLDHFLGQPVKDVEIYKTIFKTGNIPQILAATVALAVFMKASDIHIEAEGADLRIRFRVDGILKDMIKGPLPLHAALISRIKILSRLKIDETRIPQDGRFDVKTQGHEIDLRVSTLPTVRGEKAALRILDKSQSIYTLEDLGFTGRNLKVIEENITKPYGVILSTGPTGSGKSTTLYSILKKISTPAVNVITLEDPVEYEMPGINQCQVKPKIGFSFAEGLRSVLRQDPNIIMVGEIRDAETAGMTTHAALTGHLVLSTLHTNDAAGALPRLTNMGIEPFLITSSINVVIGQRLVRKVCPKCKREAHLPPQMLEEIEKELASSNLPKPYKFYEGAGCSECNNGYSGRLGIYEVLSMSEKLEELAIARRPASEIKEVAVKEGMITMKQDGLIKATKGLTTVSEVLRVTLNE